MFNVGLQELLLIFIVASVVLTPSQIPYIIKEIRKFYRKLCKIRNTALQEIDKIADDPELKEIKEKYIVGNDGQLYQSYSLDDIINKKEIPKSDKNNDMQQK